MVICHYICQKSYSLSHSPQVPEIIRSKNIKIWQKFYSRNLGILENLEIFKNITPPQFV